MNAENFFSCSTLLSTFCTNRKKTTDNSTVNWLSMRKIQYHKNQPLLLHFETYNDIMNKYDENFEFNQNALKTLSVIERKFNHDEFIKTELPILYPNGRTITTEKMKDLLNLLSYMPQQFHKFYINLGHSDVDQPEEPMYISSESDDEENGNI